jgi:hypothetical protein
MTTTFSQHQPSAQQEERPSDCSASAAFPDLSTLSTLWVPLHEVRQAWAAFGKEALTTSALMATGTAFGGLYWEAHALQHCTWAADERERARWHQVVFWLSRAVQDLDCALDQWQQVLSEYIEARQRKQQQWEQLGREYRTGPLSEVQEEEV